MSYCDHHRQDPFALTDCDRIELQLARERAEQFELDPAHHDAREFVDRMIETCGYSITVVGTGECSVEGCECDDDGSAPWSYTVGRTFFGTPELVTTGLLADEALEVTNAVGQRAPWRWEPGKELRTRGRRYRLDEVPHEWVALDGARMGAWYADFAPFHQPHDADPKVWQIVWADGRGVLPDEPGCDPAVVSAQPVLAADPLSYPPIDLDLAWLRGQVG